MIYDIVFESCPWHIRVSLFNEQGNLVAVRYDDDSLLYITGAVVLGRIRKVMKGLNAAFVDIGDVTDGFLPLDHIPKDQRDITEGQEIVVRVVRGRTEDKGARLSANVIHSRPESSVKAPHLIERAPPALSRALMDAGVHPVRVWTIDGRGRSQVLPYVQETQVYQLDQHEDVDLLDALDNRLEQLQDKVFPLEGGASLTIETTKALTSIDVDSGGVDIPDKSKMALTVNLLAAEEIARLSRMMNIGGSVIIDFITMRPKEHRREVRKRLKDTFEQTDMNKVEILELSRFGLLEMNREKTGENMMNLMKRPDLIAGELLLKLWRYKPGQYDFHIEAAPDVAHILRQRLTAAAAMAYLGRPVEIAANPSLGDGCYNISG